MALFQPSSTNKKTGQKKTSTFWWIDFSIGDKRVLEPATRAAVQRKPAKGE